MHFGQRIYIWGKKHKVSLLEGFWQINPYLPEWFWQIGSHLPEHVLENKSLFSGTVPANKFLLAETVLANNLFDHFFFSVSQQIRKKSQSLK